MKTITGRGRKILSRLFRVISVSAASLILQACYGMPPPDDLSTIQGKVVAKETQKPILGIKVSIAGSEDFEYTNKDGSFFLYVPIRDAYILKFEDVDGPYNDGLFKEQTWTLSQNDTYNSLLIGMDLDD
jgi:hypothetical protein